LPIPFLFRRQVRIEIYSRFCQKVDKSRSDNLLWGTNIKDAPDGRQTFQNKSPGILLTLGVFLLEP